MVRPFVAGVLALAGIATLGAAQEPALPDVLGKAGEYLSTYRSKVSGVTLDELIILSEVDTVTSPVPRRVASDLVLLNITDRVMGLRDPYALDTKPLREHQPRVMTALAEPTPATWDKVQGYARENAIALLHNVVLWYSDPMQALRFIDATNQSKVSYKLEGKKKINNVQVYSVGFKEKQEEGKTYMTGTPGNPSAAGRFLIDPATGAIHQTELWLQSDQDTTRVQVTYAPDDKLGMLLPKEASHSLEWRERGTNMSNMGSGGNNRRLSFQGNAKYTNPKYTPIDLSKIVK